MAIFGVVGTVSSEELGDMAKRLRHRGLNAVCKEVAPNVYLGVVSNTYEGPITHGHLSSAVDLSRASDHRVSNDAALQAYIAEGANGLDRLNTPLAFALWDDNAGVLVLGRDFLGIKPLHYVAIPGGGVAFATEYKALLALSAVPAEPDYHAIQYLQTYKHAPPGGHTLLCGVKLVPPGSVITCSRSGGVVGIERMRPISLSVDAIDEKTATTRLVETLTDAVRQQVQGRSRIGIALSGGIDSLSIAYLCRKVAPDAELVGFTSGHGSSDPDILSASLAMNRLGGTHEKIILRPSALLEQLPEQIWHLEDPIGRSETFQFFMLARSASDSNIDMLMTGLNADNLLAGMPRCKVLWLASKFPALRSDLLQFYDSTQAGISPTRPLAALFAKLYFRGNVPLVPTIGPNKRSIEPPEHFSPGPEFVNRYIIHEVQSTVPDTWPRIERTLQSKAIDFASPFLDRAVVDFSFTLSDKLKIVRGRQKHILRAAMRPLLGDLHKVPKSLMRISDPSELANSLRILADRYMTPAQVIKRGFFNPHEIQTLRSGCRGNNYHSELAMRLWTAISTEIWAQLFIDNRGRPL